MVTKNQKPITNTQKIKRKESKHITKESHKGREQEKKKEEGRTIKTTRKKLAK